MKHSSFYRICKFHFFVTLCFVLVVYCTWRPCATDEGGVSKWYDMIWYCTPAIPANSSTLNYLYNVQTISF